MTALTSALGEMVYFAISPHGLNDIRRISHGDGFVKGLIDHLAPLVHVLLKVEVGGGRLRGLLSKICCCIHLHKLDKSMPALCQSKAYRSSPMCSFASLERAFRGSKNEVEGCIEPLWKELRCTGISRSMLIDKG